MEADPPAWQEFTPLSHSIAATARAAPSRRAVVDERKSLTWAELDALVDRIAASLQRDGIKPRGAIAICASASVEYLAVFLGALRAGIAVAPLAPSSTSASLAAMIADCDAAGVRFIRTGDVGRFDPEGFLTLLDRRKDMIISGGFNIYPSDLEEVLSGRPDVSEASVVGVPSRTWGETPVAFVVPTPGAALEAEELRVWANARLGKTQRLAAIRLVERLPRSPIGKVLKRELRDLFDEAV